jgi:hypothetical protein
MQPDIARQRVALFARNLGNRNTAIMLKRLERAEREAHLLDLIRAEAHARLA